MATVEERLAYLEGKVDEQSRGTVELREAIRHLGQKIDGFRNELSSRIDALDQKVDRFREELDQKVDRFRDELSSRIDALDKRVDVRLEALDGKLTRYFTWTVGLQVTVLLAVVGALLAR